MNKQVLKNAKMLLFKTQKISSNTENFKPNVVMYHRRLRDKMTHSASYIIRTAFRPILG